MPGAGTKLKLKIRKKKNKAKTSQNSPKNSVLAVSRNDFEKYDYDKITGTIK